MLFATTSFGNGDYDLQRDSPCFPREPSCQIGSACVNAEDLSVTSCHHVMTYLHRHAKLPSGTRMATASKLIMDIMETEASVDHQMDASTMNLRLLVLLIRPRAQKSTDHVDHVSSGPAVLRPRPRRPRSHRSRPEQLRRAPTTLATIPRRNDDRCEERRYDNRDHSHGDRPKSSRTGQLQRDQPDVYPKIIFLNNAIRGNPASRGRRSTITVPGIHARGDVN